MVDVFPLAPHPHPRSARVTIFRRMLTVLTRWVTGVPAYFPAVPRMGFCKRLALFLPLLFLSFLRGFFRLRLYR